LSSNQVIRWVLKPAVFLASLGPAAWLVWALGGMFGYWPPPAGLSPNPLQDVTYETGLWALRFLCITLTLTPLRRLTGWNAVIRFRRMTGLFAFFYGSLHFLIYAIADRLLSLIDFPEGIVSWDTANRLAAAVGEDIYKRPFITVGFTALMLMLPLALTSTAASIRRLGGKRWQALHRLVYVSAIAGVVHYWWLVKADISRPRNYALIVGVLLLFRVVWARRRARKPAPVRAQTVPGSSSAGL
jgi:sulfoxide reductase heme-binding subunit YedZ